jgi:hypothetical protein
MKTVFRLLVALLAGATCLSALAAVTATLDRDQVALGETVQLLLQSDDAGGQPDIAPLRRDFDVLGSSRGSSLQIINGHSSSQTQVNLVLAPKHAGTIRIPPLQWGTEQSPALELTVSGNGGNSNNSSSGDQDATAQAGSASVFLTATLDRKQPYVQQPVVLTVRLHAAVTIDQASLDLAGNSDVLIRQIGKDTQSSESRNGRSYQVVERRYLLIPQRSGRISLKGPVLDAQVQDAGSSGFPDLDALLRHALGRNPLGAQLGMARPVHLTGDAVELNVLPRPAAATGANWLPAQQLTLEETWRSDTAPVHVGDPVTRHLHLAAVGLTGAQLPELGTLMSLPDGIKMYPDQAKVNEDTSSGTITGSRDQDIAFIANRPGHYVLPAVRLAWWDTKDKVQREARLPARTLDVLPAAGASAAVVPPAPATGNQPSSTASGSAHAVAPVAAPGSIPASVWQWVSAALALLWLGTVLAWWASHRRAATARTAAPPSARTAKQAAPARLAAGSALSALQRACRDNDAQAARRYVLEWASGFWPDSPPRGLNAVAERIADNRFSEPLRELDRACYMGSAWQGDALAQAFAAAPKAAPPAKAGKVLPDLYS